MQSRILKITIRSIIYIFFRMYIVRAIQHLGRIIIAEAIYGSELVAVDALC